MPSRARSRSVKWLSFAPAYPLLASFTTADEAISEKALCGLRPRFPWASGGTVPPVGRQNLPDLAFTGPQNVSSLGCGQLTFQHALSTWSLACSRRLNVTSFMDEHFP